MAIKLTTPFRETEKQILTVSVVLSPLSPDQEKEPNHQLEMPRVSATIQSQQCKV